MTVGMIFLTVMMTGLGCGVACGSISTPLLAGKLVSEEKSKKECINAAAMFALGKTIMYMFLGGMAAIFGGLFINHLQEVYPNISQNIFKVISILFGLMILIKSFKNNKCSSCKQCRRENFIINKFKNSSYFIIGLVYGITPCSPMIIALTYAASLNIFTAVILMLCFGVVNSIFSVIVYAPVIGIIIGKMKEEIPLHYKWIQVFSGIMLIGMAIFI